ncbi:uncharacterized protein BP5553_03656 [Venustampulla echinocandica]|uniref:Uncharacterized protein n=1 Tax=Venustampulla echinocandica TaxID=2656787 RepID=A0A370TUW6_9HELO|nr:uncharacterized protein BP5553_03656 [Venustampulla echinocandica]RDL39316.1 hypothetical protein BP5553_03656 [Venustampulla echinocandica]
MPAVRRTRHGTSGSGQPEGLETNSSMYGTRSKRKASDMNGSDASLSEQKPSTNSSQSATSEADSNAPPAKKSRASSDTPPRQTPEPEEESANGNSQEIPGVVIDPPDSPSPASLEDAPQNHVASAPPARGGFGRARGRGRGRGRWGWNRGGRGGSGLGARGTPVAEIPPSINKSLRGRGGHRVKKSDNARIQALYHRRAALKHQYKQVAQIQKVALLALAEKSLDAAKSDPTYYKTLPEFEETTRALAEIYEKRADQLFQEFQTRKAYLYSRLEKDEEYEQRRFDNAIEEVEEINEAKIKQKVIHVYRQWSTHGSLKSTPLYRDPEDKVVKRIGPPPTMVHSIATPYSFMLAENNNPVVLEQHPRDHWESMTPEQKVDWERRLDKAGGDGKRIKNSKGSALYQPQDAVVDDAFDTPNALGDAVSAMATPAVEASGDDTESEESENAEEQPTDQHGVKVPKKPTPRNGEPPQNRIVCDPPVDFDQDEIGIRKHYVRKNNRNEHQYLGMDPDPNPKKVYYDQVARAYNSARNKKEDLDQEITRAFKLHPTYGLPLPASENPDHDKCVDPPFNPPTDWSKPLEPTHPLVFIEEIPELGRRRDEDKKIFLTSRSEWIIRTNEEWDELCPKFRMTAALEQMDALDGPPRPTTPEKVKELLRRRERERAKAEAKQRRKEKAKEVIDPQLLLAINEAESNRTTEARRARKPSPAVPAAPQRSYGYDPVRDTGYQTPYQPTASVASRPEKLDALADAAIAGELRGSMPPPPAFRMHWGPPAPYHRAPPNPTTTFLPYPGPPAAPVSGGQYTSPRVAPAQGVPGPYRELRPAPPQNRTNLPAQPPASATRPWYPGYP